MLYIRHRSSLDHDSRVPFRERLDTSGLYPGTGEFSKAGAADGRLLDQRPRSRSGPTKASGCRRSNTWSSRRRWPSACSRRSTPSTARGRPCRSPPIPSSPRGPRRTSDTTGRSETRGMVMARVYDEIDQGLSDWILAQPMFFVGTVPSDLEGRGSVAERPDRHARRARAAVGCVPRSCRQRRRERSPMCARTGVW